MDSSLEESMNEQVLTMTTSAFSASGITAMPAWCRWPTMISESTRFLAQPREMRLTLIMQELAGVTLQPIRRKAKGPDDAGPREAREALGATTTSSWRP